MSLRRRACLIEISQIEMALTQRTLRSSVEQRASLDAQFRIVDQSPQHDVRVEQNLHTPSRPVKELGNLGVLGIDILRNLKLSTRCAQTLPTTAGSIPTRRAAGFPVTERIWLAC